MISHKYKCVFIHIPRTGGTSIEKSFDAEPSEPKHLFPHELRSLPEDYFKFTFVRNPWDRLLSYYRWRRHPQTTWVPKEEKKRARQSFNSWLGYVREQRAYLNTALTTGGLPLQKAKSLPRDFVIAITPQFDSLTCNGRLFVDYVGRFEDHQRDYHRICEIVGAPKQILPKTNTTSPPGERKHYANFYDKEARAIVEALYERDIAHFRYRF